MDGDRGTQPGDKLPPGFEEAFRALYPRARAVAYRILTNPTMAEDAAAEAMSRALVAWRRIGMMEHRDPWILRVTANVAVDMCRRDRRLVAADDLEAGPGVDDELDRATLHLALQEALLALPRRQREVIVLQHLVGLPQAEVAGCMGVSVGSVKRHGHRALGAMRTRMGEAWGLEAPGGGGPARVAI